MFGFSRINLFKSIIMLKIEQYTSLKVTLLGVLCGLVVTSCYRGSWNQVENQVNPTPRAHWHVVKNSICKRIASNKIQGSSHSFVSEHVEYSYRFKFKLIRLLRQRHVSRPPVVCLSFILLFSLKIFGLFLFIRL